MCNHSLTLSKISTCKIMLSTTKHVLNVETLNQWKLRHVQQKRPVKKFYVESLLMVACICHLIFFCHNALFFKKYCVVASLSQHITFWVKTHYYFRKNIVLCAMSETQYFLKNNVFWQVCHNTLFFQKILCCGKFVTTHNIFITFWVKTIFFEKIMCSGKFATTHCFFKKYCVVDMAHNTIFFERIMYFDKLATTQYFLKK